MKEKKKKPKVVYVDDGRTIYDMSGVVRPGQVIFPENEDRTNKKDKKKNNPVAVSKAEKRAMIKAAYAVYLPILLIAILGFTLALLIISGLFG